MSSTLTDVISTVARARSGWVNIDSVARSHGGIVIALVLRRGRRGRTLATWSLRCKGVRELHVSDLCGGGIRLYSSDHPAARQYISGVTRLSCRTKGDGQAAWLALASAHRAVVDDWVPLDRYLPATPPANGTIVVRAPQFLARVYARALRRIGLPVRVSAPNPRSRKGRPKVLHLGSSFVVADIFEVRELLANKQMQRTKRG